MFSTQLSESKTRNTSMPAAAALRDEEAHHVVGIVGVADRVGAAQQHLQQQVRHRARAAAPGAPTDPRAGSACATSKVAPPQHSTENSCGSSARVVRRDRHHVERAHRAWRAATGAHRAWWCRCTARAARRASTARTRSGPSSGELLLRAGRGRRQRQRGSSARAHCAGRGRPRTCALPLTMVAPMKVRMRVARSRLRGQRNSSGVSSMKRVVYSPRAKRGCVMS